MQKQKAKKILAWAGIIVLAAVYIAVFVLGVTLTPETEGLFKAAIVLAVLIPVLLYAILLVTKRQTVKKESEEDA